MAQNQHVSYVSALWLSEVALWPVYESMRDQCTSNGYNMATRDPIISKIMRTIK